MISLILVLGPNLNFRSTSILLHFRSITYICASLHTRQHYAYIGNLTRQKTNLGLCTSDFDLHSLTSTRWNHPPCSAFDLARRNSNLHSLAPHGGITLLAALLYVVSVALPHPLRRPPLRAPSSACPHGRGFRMIKTTHLVTFLSLSHP